MSNLSFDDSQEAIEIISQKDKKIADLKRQLQEVKARNIGLENCVKNQDSAVRKIGSLVASPRSTTSSDIVSTQEIEDVIDDVYRKIKRMEDIDHQLKNSKNGFEKGSKLSLKGDLEINDSKRNENDKIKDKKGDGEEQNGNGNETKSKKHKLEGKVRKAEGQIFASERAFRQIAKEQPVDDKILSMRLEQLREERDNLYDILKHYQPMIEGGSTGDGRVAQKIQSSKKFEIEATLTLDDKINSEREKKELLYHIDELRKCLEDIKKQKARKKQKDNDKREYPADFHELKARIDQLETRSHLIDGHRSIKQQQRGDAIGVQARGETGKKIDEQEERESFVSNATGGNWNTGQKESDRERSGERNHQPGFYQNGLTDNHKDGRGILNDQRRRSLVAEKPGILNENDTVDSNHVTKVLSNRIKELEHEDKKKDDNIYDLENRLGQAERENHELSKTNDKLLQKTKEMVKLCKSIGSGGNMGQREFGKGWNDETELGIELEDCVKQLIDEKMNLKTKADELEEQYLKTLKKLDNVHDEKQTLDKTVNDFSNKDVKNCAKIESLASEADQMREQIKQLEKIAEERQNKMEMLESNLNKSEADLQSEKENSNLFKSMIQQNEKIKKNLENELQEMNSKHEILNRKCFELEDGLRKEKQLSTDLRDKEKQLEQEKMGIQLENDLTVKELEDMRQILKRTQQDLLDALKYKPLFDDVKKKNAVLQKSEADLEKRVSEIKSKLEDVVVENKELRNEAEGKDMELEQIGAEINDLQQEKKKLNDEISCMERDITDQKSKINEWECEAKNLQTKVNKRNSELVENQKELGKEREKVNKCKEELKDKNEVIQKIKREKDETKDLYLKSQQEVDSVKYDKELLIEKVDEGNKRINVLEMELKSLKKLSDTQESEKGNLLEKLKAEAEINSELQKVKEKLMQENETLERDLKSEKQNGLTKERQLTEAEKLINDNSDIVQKLANDIEKLEEQNEKLEANIKSAKLENARWEEEGKDLKEQLRMSNNEFNGLQKSLEKSWKDKENIQKILGKHIDENRVLHEELRKLEEIDEMKEKRIEEFDQEVIEYRDNISKLESNINSLKSDLQDMKEKLRTREEKIHQMDKKVLERDDKLAKFYEKNNDLLQNIAKKNEEIDKVRKKNQDLIEEDVVKKSEIETLRSNLESLDSKHLAEMNEQHQKWQLFEEYNKSLRKQLDGFKKREKKFLENGNLMKIEVNKLTDELTKAKVILKDFQVTLMDKDNDLTKINDAVMLLENAYATRQAGLQKQMKEQHDELEAVTKKNGELEKHLMQKEDEVNMLQNEIDNLDEKLKHEENVIMQMQEDNERLEENVLRIKRALVEGGQKLGRKEHEVNELKNKMAHDGREVEELIEQLEATLRNVREQLLLVEEEKAKMMEMTQDDVMKIEELEMNVNEMKQEVQQKDEDLMLEKAKRIDLQKQIEDKSKEKEDRKMIEELKTELFKSGREKQFAVVKLTKERDNALLEKTAEKLAKDNLKVQLKNMKEEIVNLKKRKDEKSNEHDRYVDELKRMLAESRDREKVAVAREGDFKLKLKEMSGTVRLLESRIEDAVVEAEEEKKRREEILAQLLKPLEVAEKEMNSKESIDSDKWKRRAVDLQANIEDLKDQFSKYKNKAIADNEVVKVRIGNAKDEEIMRLKSDLEEAEKGRTELRRRFNELRSELVSLDKKRQQSSQDNDRLAEELRLAKQEAMIQKHELDWLRNVVDKFGNSSAK